MDDFVVGEHVTHIKMDVEGAEYDALRGAEKIISEQAPKLAISIYHYIQDLWRIPLLIKKYRNDYKIYMRHHCNLTAHETVCYAIPRGIGE